MTNSRTKVHFTLPNGPIAGETLWAERVGDGLYRLLNIPFHVMGYAEGDIVRCMKHENAEEVVSLEKDSGNGVIRIMFTDSETQAAQDILAELTSVGCQYERASSQLVAMTVPPHLAIPFSQVANYLNSTNDDIVTGWEVGKRLTRP